PIASTPILRKKQAGTKVVDLIDLEETGNSKDPDVEMEEVHEDHENLESQDPVVHDQEQDESAAPLESKKVEPPKINKKKEDVKVVQKKVPVIRRKNIVEDELPQISSLVTPYSIVADVRDKPANITIGQLLQVTASMRQELSRSLQKKRIVSRKKVQANVNIQPTLKSTALYCDAKVYDQVIPLIVDSGSSGSVVTSHLLNDLGIRIERPSVVNMVNIHGESKRAIGEISDFPFNIGGVEIPIDVVVTDAHSYCAIVGNDWLAKVNATIDWNSSEMTLIWDEKEIIVPVEFRKLAKVP
ncbi:2525_t:CDS:1, partial [Ambispora leptoticha]